MSSGNKLPVGSSPIFKLAGLQNAETGVFINDADVEVTLKDPDGVNVPGVSWPLELPNVGGSNGDYSQTTDPISGLVEGTIYTAEFVATGIDGLIGEFCLKLKAQRCC